MRGSSQPPPPFGQPLVVGLRLQCDAEPLDPYRIAGVIEANPRDADARIIASRDEPWKQIKIAVRTANGSRIQDALDFLWITRFRLHDLPEPLQLKAVHRLTSLRGSARFSAIQASDDGFNHRFRLMRDL